MSHDRYDALSAIDNLQLLFFLQVPLRMVSLNIWEFVLVLADSQSGRMGMRRAGVNDRFILSENPCPCRRWP